MLQAGKDMICICILTHGKWDKDGQHVMFSDCKTITIEHLTDGIMTCPDLINRPKLVVVQACRGDQYEFQQIQIESDDATHRVATDRYHSVKDRAIFWSTAIGNKAYRPRTGLSFFIEHLCEVLDQSGETDTFDVIAKRVNKQMCEEPPIRITDQTGHKR